MPRLKPVVFISSTAQDLREHREAAARAARQAGFDVEMMEDFEARTDHPPYAGCMSKVRECDVLVALVAHRYGWIPSDQPDKKQAKSITWLECEEMKAKGGELLVFTLDPKHSWPAERKESYRATEAVERGKLTPKLNKEITLAIKKLGEFKSWLDSLGFRKTFTTPDSVNSLVQESLTKWKARQPGVVAPGTTEPRKDDPTEYLRTLREQTAWIDIRGLGAGKAHRFPITELYIPLTTLGGDKTAGAPRNILLEEALNHSRLVIEGDPGAGKTTFLRRIAWDLCAESPALKLPERGFPVWLRAGDLEQHIRQCRAQKRPGPTTDHHPAWLAHCLAAIHPSLDQDFFERQLRAKGTWVLLDGLDEATNETRRAEIIQIVEAAALAYPLARFVVTTRPAAAVNLFDARVTIAELDDSAIAGFLGHWSRALNPDSATLAEEHENKLSKALHGKPAIRRMARNPVMLTALAVVHWNEGQLPEQRGELYERIVTWLAKAREKQGRETPTRVVKLLGALALAMQRRPEGRITQVSRATAADLLRPSFGGDLERAREFIATEEVDSGIFITRGRDLRFWHLTLQEYLAATALAGLEEKAQYELLLESGNLHRSEWREVVLLFGQVLCKQGTDKTDALFRKMLEAIPAAAQLEEKARWVGLIGSMLADLKPYGYEFSDTRYGQMLDDVLAIFDLDKSKTVDFQIRLKAAEALGQAGDPRLRTPGDEEYWITIPAGTFLMGEGEDDDETPHEVELSAYQIGRYPVTVAEYRDFLEHCPDQTKPPDWDKQEAFGNRPVVGVTWFDADAYCRWASQRWRRTIRLLTEAEWERAARGMEGRRHAWGNADPTPDLANYTATNAKGASPVGLFPQGVTPEPERGISDLAGNVWEWCADWYGTRYYRRSPRKDPKGPAKGYSRCLRGGGWNNQTDGVRAAFRVRNLPQVMEQAYGFRCAQEPYS